MWGCRTVGRCRDVCPKDVRPTDGIRGIRRRRLVQRLKGLFHRLPSPASGRGAGGEGGCDRRTFSRSIATTSSSPPSPLPEGEGTSGMGSEGLLGGGPHET